MGSKNNLVGEEVVEYLPSQDAPVYVVAAAAADSPENSIEGCRQGEREIEGAGEQRRVGETGVAREKKSKEGVRKESCSSYRVGPELIGR